MSMWRPLFGHAEPYSQQAEGIETVLEALGAGGYVALEGACGTGKTMLALTAGLAAVRDDRTPYERVFVVTSVKQQLRAFEADLERIDAGLPPDRSPVSAVTLVGKADVCPYHLAGQGGMSETNLYDRCENLRDRTRELVDAGQSAGTLAKRAHEQVAGEGFAIGASRAPYPGTMPRADAPGELGEVEYCPFYASYLEDRPAEGDPSEAVPFEYRGTGPLTPEELVRRGVAVGSCPHSLMGAILQDAEVVVGNYYHAFDERTVAAFTGPLVDASTVFVCDEAHMLEDRVRDLASDTLAVRTLDRARDELASVIEFAKGREGDGARAVTESALEEADLSRQALSRYHSFLGTVVEAVDTVVREEEPTGASTLALRDPTTVEPDRLTTDLVDAGHGETVWCAGDRLGPVVERALNAVDGEERWRATPSVGRFLAAWWLADHESYFRMVEVEPRERHVDRAGWRGRLRARLHLRNCLPGDVIASVLDGFGGGVLMSATLEPMDAFAEVVGLDRLETASRPVRTARYGLPFPHENRLSLIVDAPKFTYRNRGPPSEPTPTRERYAEAIATVATAPGNALVGMPSYAEARWAAAELERRLDRPILLDQSSDRATTDALKARFFEGEPKVLVTSLRGTLTEGVDYEGDRLAAAVVCGVPIINTSDPATRAMQTAYERRFDNGFDHGLVVPAVRKARQALGRVIRGPEEVGVRVLVDERYRRSGWDGVNDHLPESDEFVTVQPDDLQGELERFWARHRGNT